ncbi:3 5 -cyclic nucleotide phosphodiesterase domain-containing protein [Cyclospora cayetanensis]|uniref:Phosphodiesterase n=1 Tax=Cyclospora cayetanensis TaxID=88456 RepID=A0A1D3D8C1_9EIME|nr:3 5 -cyclic nucleotide phosphodiesterase domain-containing protein [Cyclospora cayetanensis]
MGTGSQDQSINWGYLPYAKKLSAEAPSCQMELQTALSNRELSIHRFQGATNTRFSVPGRRSRTSQCMASCPLVVGTTLAGQDIRRPCVSSKGLEDAEAQESPGRSVDLQHPAYRRTFNTIPFHWAVNGSSAAEDEPRSRSGKSDLESMAEVITDEQKDDRFKAASRAATRAAFARKQRRFCCSTACCQDAVKVLARDVWARETAFILKEEADSRKRDLSSRVEADVSTPKASHVILAAQHKGSRDSLTLCPLRFTDRSMEAEFAYNQERSARFRNVMAGATAATLVAIDVVLAAVLWNTGMFMHDPVIFASFMVFFLLCTFLSIMYAMSYRIPYLRNYLEFASYFIVTSAVIAQTILGIWWKTALYSKENYLRFAPSVSKSFGLEYDPAIPGDRMNSVAYHFVVLLNELFLDSGNFPTKVGSILRKSAYAICACTHFASMASVVGILSIAASGFVGSYPMELRRRGLFYEWLSMKRAVANLLDIRKRAQKAAGSSSALDDIRSNCTRLSEILADLKQGAGKFDVAAAVSQGLTLIQECLFIFATCKNLYITSINEDLKDESYIKAFNLGRTQTRNLLNADSAISSTIGRQSRLGPGGEKLAPVPSDLQSRAGMFPPPACDLEARHAALLLPIVGLDLGFDPLEFERAHANGRSSVLLDAGTALLGRVASDWGCDELVLRNFLVQIDSLYQNQPYHNAKHGTLVAHSMSLLCRTLGIFRESAQALNTITLYRMNALGVGACLVAALCHDVGHPGRNNNFFVAEMSALVRISIVDLIVPLRT